MEHVEAVRTGAVERYLLGQLSGSECDEFENHFFDCAECAEELRMGAVLEENARAVFQEDALKRAPGRVKGTATKPSLWDVITGKGWGAVAVFAALVLLVVAGYQNLVVIPGLRADLRSTLAAQSFASFLLSPVTRGEGQTRVVAPAGAFYSLYMDTTWEGSYKAYVCTVQDETGAGRLNVPLPAPAPGKPLEILMARSSLPSGTYTVIIHSAPAAGKPERELARYALTLKLE